MRKTIRLTDTQTGMTATITRLPSLPGSRRRMYSVGMMVQGGMTGRPQYEEMSRRDIKAMLAEMAGRVVISREA